MKYNYNCTVILFASLSLVLGCQREASDLSPRRHVINASLNESSTRTIFVEKDGSYDLLTKWQGHEYIQVFMKDGDTYNEAERKVQVSKVTQDGIGATFSYRVPDEWGNVDSYDVRMFTTPCFAKFMDGKVYYNASIIREPISSFQVPVYSEGEIEGEGVLNTTFHHYYTYELLHIKNTSDSDIEFSLLGFSGTTWYKEKGSLCIDDGSFVIDAPSTKVPKRESDLITIKPGETQVIVSAYIPNGNTINEVTMVTLINGEYVYSSNTKTSGIELKQGHAYHMYAGWNGHELRFWDDGEEPLDVRTLTASIDPQYLSGEFTGAVVNPPLSEIKTGFRFWKENNPEDYVEYDSTSSDNSSFSLNLTYDDFVYIANESPVEGKYFVSAFAIDAKGTRHPGNVLEFTIESGQPVVPVIPEAVDLGLSVKWASFNLGSTKPEDYGAYYAWGETEPYYSSLEPLEWKVGKEAGYDWPSYKWCKGSYDTLTKYCTNSSYGYEGYTDGKTVLDPEDDAAHVNLGGNWRIPTDAEWTELEQKCTWKWTSVNGVNGREVTGPNGNSIFLPAAGFWSDTNHNYSSSIGYYWSSSIYSDYVPRSWGLGFGAGDIAWTYTNHCWGQSIRPVYGNALIPIESITLDKTDLSLYVGETANLVVSISPSNASNQSIYWESSNESVASVSTDGVVTGVSVGSAFITVTTVDGGKTASCRVTIAGASSISVPEVVDLGLPSGLKWASFNLGARSPEENGDYYAWGETEPKEVYSWATYKWSMGTQNSLTKYCFDSQYGFNGSTDNQRSLLPEDDAAHVNLGGNWRMPTHADYDELYDNTTLSLAEYNGVKVFMLKSKINENAIYLPIAGYRDENPGVHDGVTYRGFYWLSDLILDRTYDGDNICLSNEDAYIFTDENYLGTYTWSHRYKGYSIRPVHDDSWQKAEIEVFPTDIEFGAVPYGSSSTEYVTVKNIGSGVLSFTVENVSAPFSVTPTSYSLSAGESVQLAFTFKPVSATSGAGGRCTIVSNATQNVVSVTYSGSGTESGVSTPEAVDLGLSVKWASFNLGASKPEEYGDHYAWGETEPYYSSLNPLIWKEGNKSGYNWSSYKWCMGTSNTMTKYCFNSSYGYNGFTDNKTVLDLEDDAAHVNLGGKWRMPTDAEWTELREKCTWTWTVQNGVGGRLVTGSNGNSIFLPAAGYWFAGGRDNVGSGGDYWSSSLSTDDPGSAWYVYIYSDRFRRSGGRRYYGFSVRPVCE